MIKLLSFLFSSLCCIHGREYTHSIRSFVVKKNQDKKTKQKEKDSGIKTTKKCLRKKGKKKMKQTNEDVI